MQALTAPPRDTLTDDQVMAVLLADELIVDAGLEIVTIDSSGLTVVDDISDQLQPGGSSITWDANTIGEPADVNRDITLVLSQQLQWGTDLVRPRLELTSRTGAGDLTAAFYLGVYCLTSPDEPIGLDPITYTVTGNDRLYLLKREVGDSYVVGAGSSYVQAVLDLFGTAGLAGASIDPSSIDLTLPTDMAWPLLTTDGGNPTTWLDIANDLLAAINYVPLWTDEQGNFRSQPYLTPRNRPSEFTLSADDLEKTIVGAGRIRTQDLYAAPNKWIFVRSGFTGIPAEGDGMYTVTNDSNGPSSIAGRGGLVFPKQFTVDAADQTTLEALGDAQVDLDLADAITFASFPTGCLPIAGQDDVMTLIDTAAGGTMRVLATSWTLQLDGSDMSWDLQVIP